MDKAQIITIILTAIITGIIAPFSKSIFDKIFAAYNPDPKKISSGIKKSLVFTLRYLSPIANLIYVYATRKTVDKYLVFVTVFIFSVLVLNIVLDKFYRFIDKIVNGLIDIAKSQHGTSKETISILKSLVDIQKQHIDVTSELKDITKNVVEEKQHPT